MDIWMRISLSFEKDHQLTLHQFHSSLINTHILHHFLLPYNRESQYTSLEHWWYNLFFRFILYGEIEIRACQLLVEELIRIRPSQSLMAQDIEYDMGVEKVKFFVEDLMT